MIEVEKMLFLPIKGHWLEKIISGEKGEEYREIKPHWMRRMFSGTTRREVSVCVDMIDRMTKPPFSDRDVFELMQYFKIKLVDYKCVVLANGYRRDSRRYLAECKGVSIGIGRPEWGAPQEFPVFILKLGSVSPVVRLTTTVI